MYQLIEESTLFANRAVKPDTRIFLALAVVLGAFPAMNALGSGAFTWSSSARTLETVLAVLTFLTLLTTLVMLATRRQLMMNILIFLQSVIFAGSLSTRMAEKVVLGQIIAALDWICVISLAAVALTALFQARRNC